MGLFLKLNRGMILAALLAVTSLLWVGPGAAAETYLLPTAIVLPGHVEMELEYRSSRVRSNVALPGTTFDGFFKTSSSIMEMSVGVGIYPGLQVFVDLPYLFLERGHQQITDKATSETADRAGTGDPTFTALYRVLEEGPLRPAVVVEAGIKPDLASDGLPDPTTGKRGGAGSGTLDYQFGLDASKVWGDWTPYATAAVLHRGETDEGLRRADEWGGSLGTEYQWTRDLTLDVAVKARHIGHDEIDDTGGRETYHARVRAYYSFWNNWTVIPSLAFIRTSAYDSQLSTGIRNENNRGYEVGIGLYTVY